MAISLTENKPAALNAISFEGELEHDIHEPEMPKPPSQEPLIPDSKRQAHATIGAFDFQLWHTVLAWLELADSSFLVVEGAEDFEVVESGGVKTVQVKAGKAPITMNSPDVVKAIQNYWDTCVKNPGREVQCRFLTQADMGTEAGRRTGGGKPLLAVWSEVAARKSSVDELRKHLAGIGKFSESLAEFIRSATDDELINRLICRIKWDVRNLDTRGLLRSIDECLVLLGDKQSVPPSWAKESRHMLYSLVVTAASNRAHPPLTRVDLLEAFENATKPRRTADEDLLLRQAVRRAAESETAMGTSGEPSVLTIDEPKLGPPPLPAKVASRPPLVADVTDKLKRLRAVFLVGSTGMGKTTLANLVVRSVGGRWIWWTGRDRESQTVRSALGGIAREVRKRNLEGVVLDDLNLLPSEVAKCEEELRWLFFEAKASDSALIVTSQRDPRGLDFVTDQLEQESFLKVPPMSRDEILALAYDLGCPRRSDVERMATILELATSGHPQLIMAQLSSLRRKNWEVPQIAELIRLSPDALQKKLNARSMVSDLPGSQKDMLLRVSMIRCPFRRRHALSLGAVPPKIGDPGFQFDQLVGPWIEPLHDDSFRVSPLIIQMAEETMSQLDLVELHNAIAGTLFDKHMSDYEVEATLWHAWKAQSAFGLSVISQAVIGLKPKVFEELAPLMTWFAIEKTFDHEQEVLFAQSPGLSVMLRVLQFKIATPVSTPLAAKVFERLESEANALNDPESRRAMLHFMGALAWISPKARLSPSDLLRCLGYMRANNGTDDSTEGIDVPAQLREALEKLTVKGSWARKAATFTQSHCKSIADLKAWINALKAAPPEVVSEWTAAHEEMPTDAKWMIDSAWLHESDQANPNWLGALETLDEATSFGMATGCLSLATFSIDAKAVILDEYLKKPRDALQALDVGEALFSEKQPTLLDRRARILGDAGEHEAAILLWKDAFSLWSEQSEPLDSTRAFAARLAAISAGKLGLHKDSAAWFELALKNIGKFGPKKLLIGLRADAGLAHWKAFHKERAIEHWFDALCLIEKQPKNMDDLVGFRIRKCTSHTIAWLFGKLATGGGNLAEPSIGFCSALDTNDALKSLPESDWNQMWVMLLTIATEAGVEGALRAKIESKIEAELPIEGRSFYALDAVQHALVTLNLASLPQLLFHFAQATNESKKAFERSNPESAAHFATWSLVDFNPDEDALGKAPYIAALIALAGADQCPADIVPQWRESAKQLPWAGALGEWFNSIEKIFLMQPSLAVAAASSDAPFWAEKAVAALAVVCSDKSRAIEIAHAQYPLLVQAAHPSAWKKRLGRPLDALYARRWSELMKSPALLVQPSKTIPKLKEAIESSVEGFAKAGEITIAAASAMGLKMPIEVLNQIRAFRDD